MTINIVALMDAADKARLDRKLADKVEMKMDHVEGDIRTSGRSVVTLNGRVFDVSRKAAGAK